MPTFDKPTSSPEPVEPVPPAAPRPAAPAPAMPRAAYGLALATVALWSTLALLGARLAHVPPFLLVGAALTVAGLAGAVSFRRWRVPPGTFAVGVGGIFGYHFLYFSAFRHAPAVEANLINYLWPLLIVVLSPLFLPGYRLRAHHLVGAAMGLAGAGLAATGGRLRPEAAHLPGYLLAGGAAVVWASYSLMTRRLPPFPTEAVGGFCLASGLLSLGVHFAAYPTPALSVSDGTLLLLLGLGPMGTAFFTWDAALKRGDPRVIGSLAYLTPLLSTLLLVLAGGRALSPATAAAMALIVGGAVVGAWSRQS